MSAEAVVWETVAIAATPIAFGAVQVTLRATNPDGSAGPGTMAVLGFGTP